MKYVVGYKRNLGTVWGKYDEYLSTMDFMEADELLSKMPEKGGAIYKLIKVKEAPHE